MKKTLTTLLVLACGLTLDTSHAQTSEGPLEEIIVTGEYAGPGMWQVTHPDHQGHTLWIVGEPPLLPQGMRFHSQQVANVASVSALAMTTPVPTDLREQMEELWFSAAGSAVTKNESTLAFVPMSALLGEHGYLESLRKRGYEILATG